MAHVVKSRMYMITNLLPRDPIMQLQYHSILCPEPPFQSCRPPRRGIISSARTKLSVTGCFAKMLMLGKLLYSFEVSFDFARVILCSVHHVHKGAL